MNALVVHAFDEAAADAKMGVSTVFTFACAVRAQLLWGEVSTVRSSLEWAVDASVLAFGTVVLCRKPCLAVAGGIEALPVTPDRDAHCVTMVSLLKWNCW